MSAKRASGRFYALRLMQYSSRKQSAVGYKTVCDAALEVGVHKTEHFIALSCALGAVTYARDGVNCSSFTQSAVSAA
jgi:hypothetical protein